MQCNSPFCLHFSLPLTVFVAHFACYNILRNSRILKYHPSLFQFTPFNSGFTSFVIVIFLQFIQPLILRSSLFHCHLLLVFSRNSDCSAVWVVKLTEMANNLSLEDGMKILDEAFYKTRMIMEGNPNVKFSAEEYQRFYECVYLLCVQRTSCENSRMLYERYKNGLEECINSLVLPSLENKNDAALLTELVVKWNSYQLMARLLSRFFSYLDRFYIPRVGALGLLELAIRCFHNMVDERCNTKLVTAVISLVDQDRNGVKIDRNLLKNVGEYFDFVRTLGGTTYDDFEKALLASSASYYSQIASHGLLHESCANYMYKVQWCLNQENERASQFLNLALREKLMQVVKSCLVDQVWARLAEKQQAENYGNSTDYEDLLSKCADLNLRDPGSDRNWNMVQQQPN